RARRASPARALPRVHRADAHGADHAALPMVEQERVALEGSDEAALVDEARVTEQRGPGALELLEVIRRVLLLRPTVAPDRVVVGRGLPDQIATQRGDIAHQARAPRGESSSITASVPRSISSSVR